MASLIEEPAVQVDNVFTSTPTNSALKNCLPLRTPLWIAGHRGH